jgi:hypothetical protein
MERKDEILREEIRSINTKLEFLFGEYNNTTCF